MSYYAASQTQRARAWSAAPRWLKAKYFSWRFHALPVKSQCSCMAALCDARVSSAAITKKLTQLEMTFATRTTWVGVDAYVRHRRRVCLIDGKAGACAPTPGSYRRTEPSKMM
jgi:hypothetical protein